MFGIILMAFCFFVFLVIAIVCFCNHRIEDSIISILISLAFLMPEVFVMSDYLNDFGYIGSVARLEVGGEYLVLGTYRTPKGNVILLQHTREGNYQESSRFVKMSRPFAGDIKAVTVLERNGEKELVPLR